LKLLCAADLHIGRRPTRLPAGSAGSFSAAAAWGDLVDVAVSRSVDVVLLAGDVVDQENRYFEAYGPLGAGVRRLKEAGIAAVAVAGNHDHQALHEVAREVGGGHLRVLGRGGRWERWTLRGEGGRALLHVDGWSFPAGRHPDDPASSYDLPAPDAADEAPVVGLLHCHLDGREPHYAPVPAASLARLPVSAWILGHMHVPELREVAGRAPVLYPGSLLALDPGEAGLRGAWLVELEPGRPPVFRHLPLSRVRYESVDVDVHGAADPESLRAAVAGALRRRLEEVVAGGAGPLELVSCRVRLEGRTPLHLEAERLVSNLVDLELMAEGGVRLVVERVAVDTRPAVDLHDLARGSDAPGLLARLLLALEGGGEAADTPGPAADVDLAAVLAAAERGGEQVVGRSYYADLAAAAPPVRTAMGRQAARLLDELVRQKEAV
jgi:DNA repair protein SbcD/Mre11